MECTIHGSFVLADVEFALPAHAVREVVNEPERYDPLPLAPDYVRGLLNLRGVIIPVVDLRVLFRLERTGEEPRETRKIAIVERRRRCIGLLFDDIREVFNAATVERCLFDSDGDDLRRRAFRGVFKLDRGERIVHILDVDALFGLGDLPKTAIDDAPAASVLTRNVRRQCISFLVGDARCGLDIDVVKEIIAFEGIDNTMLASSPCLGAIELRGETIPIIEFRKVLGYAAPDSPGRDRRVIILNVESHLVGLLVESIDSIVTYFERELIPYPNLGGTAGAAFEGCLADAAGDARILLVDHAALVGNDRVLGIARAHGELFRPLAESDSAGVRDAFDRQSLITFSLDSSYALDIRDVKEVIARPERLLAAPDTCPGIKGMFSLRGELVTLIDSGSLCGDAANDDDGDDASSKVLVYERDEIKYGLMVRSVDSIVPYRGQDRVELPATLKRAAGDADWTIGDAVGQAVRAEGRMIRILDLDRITAGVRAG